MLLGHREQEWGSKIHLHVRSTPKASTSSTTAAQLCPHGWLGLVHNQGCSCLRDQVPAHVGLRGAVQQRRLRERHLGLRHGEARHRVAPAVCSRRRGWSSGRGGRNQVRWRGWPGWAACCCTGEAQGKGVALAALQRGGKARSSAAGPPVLSEQPLRAPLTLTLNELTWPPPVTASRPPCACAPPPPTAAARPSARPQADQGVEHWAWAGNWGGGGLAQAHECPLLAPPQPRPTVQPHPSPLACQLGCHQWWGQHRGQV